MFPSLETERLILREIEKDDAEQIFACFSNSDVTRYYGQELFESIEQAEKLAELFKHQFNEKRGIRWGIGRKDAEGIIGTVGFHAWVPKHRRAQAGYEIHPEYWRNGYAFEAVSNVLSYGFEVMKLCRIGAVVFLDNAPSHKLLTKMGFQMEGVLRGYMNQNGMSHDTNVYSLLKENHPSLP
ncbi:acetyltransferase [Bacillus nakamurai]|uniref:GNAT family N-acetyltransferase n=1 Tax=Bacillus nakamurai TaxID=1793963 RepID=UPI000778412F|nr:GNAT family protein [Bacillus nakamurai]KXZ23640.1 acetyltransferase [Bacillus nakamurai]